MVGGGWVVGGGLEQFSVSPRPLGFGFGTKGFWAKGLGPGLDNNIVTGIRESCHVPTGTAAIWRGEGAGRVLHHPMCRHRGDRGHEGPGVQCPAPGGDYIITSSQFIIRPSLRS